MGVTKRKTARGVTWAVDEWIGLPNGRQRRFRKCNIPTRELALALAAKVRAEAFEGVWFEPRSRDEAMVSEIWALYEPITKRDNDSARTDCGRARHLVRHLGSLQASALTRESIDRYRNARLRERTQRGQPPSPTTLDRELELLKRMLNYAVDCGRLSNNPVARVKLLRRPNVRRTVFDEADFQRLYEAAEAALRPILIVAFDTGMRKQEILDLRWEQVDLREGVIRLEPEGTKEERHRVVYLTGRAQDALRRQPRRLRCPHVFVNPTTGRPWQEIRKMFRRACEGAEIEGAWFHDLRRSFVTKSRRAGIPESVVMRMSGHRTRAVFDRYNIVSEDDLRQAVATLELTQCVGQDLDTEGNPKAHKAQDPAR